MNYLEKKKKITPYEKEVLDTLWGSEQALTAREIVNYCDNKSWKPSYIHIMINSLLEKKLIKEVGFKQTTKNFARMYRPTMTKDEWMIYQLTEEVKDQKVLMKYVLSEILKDTWEIKEIDELQAMLNERKRKISGNT